MRCHERRVQRAGAAGLAVAATLLLAGRAPSAHDATSAANASAAPSAPAPAASPSSSAQAAPSEGLEPFLRLPGSIDYSVERRGGATRGEWRARFREARKALEDAQAALKRAQRKLDNLADTSQGWQLAPPGAGDVSDAPLSFELREEVRRQREEIERARRHLRELEIQADLAGVPEQWRH